MASAGLATRTVALTGWAWRWGLQTACAALAVVGGAEAARLLRAGDTDLERSGGWYLLVVSGLVALGIFARPVAGGERSTMAEGGLAVSIAIADSATTDRAVGSVSPSAGSPADPEPADPETADGTATKVSHAREAVIFFAAAVAFAWALPRLGFAIANGLFIALYLIFVDHRAWYKALLIAALVDGGIVVAMNSLQVVLPRGVFGLEW
jgi:hypothetical protein